MLSELRLRLRILLQPRAALPIPFRLTPNGFVDFGGVVYQSPDEFVAGLRRIRPKQARFWGDPNTNYDRVCEVLLAFQQAEVGTDLGFRGNLRPESEDSEQGSG